LFHVFLKIATAGKSAENSKKAAEDSATLYYTSHRREKQGKSVDFRRKTGKNIRKIRKKNRFSRKRLLKTK